MDVPDPPDGYEQPQIYHLPTWAMVVTGIGLAVLVLAITISLNVQYKIPSSQLSFITAFAFASAGSLYLHESVHYIVADYVGYEPIFVWPNRVDFGIDILQTKETVMSLLAPQLLSIIYLTLIYIGVVSTLEVILFWAFVLNFLAGVYDIAWAIRRLTWPKGTIVILCEGENHVAFPEA
jgi:hypothetical protein